MKNLIIIGHPDKKSFCYNGIMKTIQQTLKENNWTWVLTETEANIEHTLSVLKYPQTDGYATIITNSYGQIKTTEVLRNNLDNNQFILNQLVSLTELPF